jgi:formamidopyrimidine-DNA glycosylase
MDEKQFTFERFSELLDEKHMSLKSVLVGKEAVVVGLGNSAFQDIAYRAKINPKRRVSELNKDEKRALYDAKACALREN